MQKIFVTGCAGFIGSHLCERLLQDENIEIFGIDNLNDYYDISKKNKNLDILKKYKNFIFEKDDLVTTTKISEFKPNIVVNLGAMAGVRYSLDNPEIYSSINTEGQTHLLNECVKNKVKLYVYASSSSVYGTNTKIPFEETDSLDNMNSPYAVSKRSGELMAQLFSKLYDIQTIGLRFFTVYGPRGRPDMAPYKFLNAIMTETKFDKYGDGSSMRDYTYIDDIISGIIGAIKNKLNKKCEIYNLGNNTPISLNEFIKTCEEITGKNAQYIQKNIQQGDVNITCANIKKAKNDLDYNPRTSIIEGLKKTYDWIIQEKN